ncbi:putative peptidase C1-like protein F26E4.3 [Tachypleus tridentatus]|uniref:putative peptidase C1-like protein F26E4.3 n=1 Tax=Tachypleus tridentatus TaxID=6853 RepID=UPI003FD672B2
MVKQDYWSAVLSVVIVLACISLISTKNQYQDLQGDYCRVRRPVTCCQGRDDSCTVPILDTVCYCDLFCDRTNGEDCCPDFWDYCLGERTPPPPEPVIKPHCYQDGVRYNIGQKFKKNCNTCECRYTSADKFDFVCEDKPCLIQPKLNEAVNQGNYGWKSSNYSFFWGQTLEEGIRYHLGTFKPYGRTFQMNEMRIKNHHPLPETFDSRLQWPGLIQGISDQGNCSASWAFSTAALSSDRRAIQSKARERIILSPQQLISCNIKGQKGCEGGHVDRAWWFMRKQGLTSQKCYPYTSGQTGQKDECMIHRERHRGTVQCPSGIRDEHYKTTPPYRVGHLEEDIMYDIYTNGPVQATFRVMQDFFSYASGIYQKLPQVHSKPPLQGWHSVRIIGWGVDRSQGRKKKYWLCANSWGRDWGENGYFRIVRGQNECDIESFVVGVWAKKNHFELSSAR